MKKLFYLVLLISIATLTSCKKHDHDPGAKTRTFTVSIENVSTAYEFFAGGNTEGIGPGSSITIEFDAGVGHYLSFSTMLAQSNDLFFGFADMGLALYDGSGDAVTGDLTSMVYLWDAGTEVNEEPGVGENQAPRQSGPNTGMDEGGTVKMLSDVGDGFMYPAISELIEVWLDHDGGTKFMLTIENKSDMISLTGPFAPGVWAVHGSGSQLFTENEAADSKLEKLAEDGDNADFADYIAMNSGLVSPFAPGVFAVFSGSNPIFKMGMESSAELEALAEDGDPSGFNFDGEAQVGAWGVFVQPTGASGPAPIFPGEKYEFEFMGSQGEMLSFATMLVQSNDLFAAPTGISLFHRGIPLSGDITHLLELWDAKTELNEAPGAGMYQAPRQPGPNTGTSETGAVELVNDGYTYPALSDLIRVTISYQ